MKKSSCTKKSQFSLILRALHNPVSLFIIVISLFFSIFAVTAQAKNLNKLSAIIVFGDSYLDNGASMHLSKQALAAKIPSAVALPADPALKLYKDGHWSNGPTAVEYLAKLLGANLTDYAVGGAKSGSGNYYAWLDAYTDSGLLGQVADHKASLNGKFLDSKTLYVIAASANDYFQFVDFSQPGKLDNMAERAAVNTYTAVQRLVDSGAQSFLIVKSYALTDLPYITANKQVDQAKLYSEYYNASLDKLMKPLLANKKLSITMFDWQQKTHDIATTKAKYGITNTTDACQVTMPLAKAACATPNSYLFWDEYHPSTRAHEILGQMMFSTLGYK